MKKLKALEKEIQDIKERLMQIGEMRPGNLNQQFRKSEEKLGEYFQLNYTFGGRSRTEHVRKENVGKIKSELTEYQKAKELFSKWVELSIEASKVRSKMG